MCCCINIGNGDNKGSLNEASELFLTDSDIYSKGINTTPVVIDNVQAGLVSGIATQDPASGILTINKPGLYKVSLNISFSLNQGAKVDGAIYANGVIVEKIRFERDIFNANDVGDASSNGLLAITAPTELELRISADNSRTLTIKHLNIDFFGIGVAI